MSTKQGVIVEAPRATGLSGYVPALDGVRGIAIATVLFVHTYTFITANLPRAAADAIARVGEVGAFGVDLFFVLSGFLITGILLDTRSTPHYFRNFYARRFLRLFPVYYAYLAFVALLLPLLHTLLRTSIPDYHGPWWWYVLYFCNWKPGNAAGDPALGHFWSLAVEEQFYILWPAIVLLLSRRWLAVFCSIMALTSLSLRLVWADQNVYWNVIYRLTVTRLDTLALGALAAMAIRSGRWRPVCEKYAATIMIAGLSAFAVVAAMSGSFSWEARPVQTVGAFVAAIGFAGLVLRAALFQSGALYRLLLNRVLTAYGKYSYGMYVYHVVILVHFQWMGSWIARHLPDSLALINSILMMVLANWFVFAFSRFSYERFEKPILRYKDRFQDAPRPAIRARGAV